MVNIRRAAKLCGRNRRLVLGGCRIYRRSPFLVGSVVVGLFDLNQKHKLNLDLFIIKV